MSPPTRCVHCYIHTTLTSTNSLGVDARKLGRKRGNCLCVPVCIRPILFSVRYVVHLSVCISQSTTSVYLSLCMNSPFRATFCRFGCHIYISPSLSLPPPPPLSLSLSLSDGLVGLEVKASTSRAADPGFAGIFPGSHFSDLKIDIPVATLPGVIGSALRLVGPVSVYCDWGR